MWIYRPKRRHQSAQSSLQDKSSSSTQQKKNWMCYGLCSNKQRNWRAQHWMFSRDDTKFREKKKRDDIVIFVIDSREECYILTVFCKLLLLSYLLFEYKLIWICWFILLSLMLLFLYPIQFLGLFYNFSCSKQVR